jgi:hypothetical protein
MSKNLLSKSTFIRSVQCQKSLYLYKRHKELQDETSQEQRAVFSRGHQVGFMARKLFPGGIDSGWKSPRYYRKSVTLTQKLIAAGMPVIYEAAFVSDNILVAADIFVRDEEGGWHLYEVKSTLQPSETFLRDAALQYRVITKAGVDLRSVSLVHLNRNYIRQGPLDFQSLFTTTDVTEQVKIRQAFVLSGIVAARETLRYRETPEVRIGPHCHSPYPCDFLDHCWKSVPDRSVFDLSALEPERKWKLYDQGIVKLDEVPASFPFTKAQQAQYDALLKNEVFIDRSATRKFLDKIKFPAAFLDFNAARPAIPVINGARPYQNIPYQFSISKLLHIAAPVQESFFIADADEKVTEKFLAAWMQQTEGLQTIVVFDKYSEMRLFKDLAAQFPAWQTEIQDRVKKMIDLADVFRIGLFFHPGMKNGLSLSSALAVFGIDFQGEPEISSHYMAGVAFEQFYSARDIFYFSTVKGMLLQFAQSNSQGLFKLFFALREEALKEAAVQ